MTRNSQKQRFEQVVSSMVHQIIGGDVRPTPDWLERPGRLECGENWPLVRAIYTDLTGLNLPEVMPSREMRRVDAVFVTSTGRPFIFEFDEKQHFNGYRATTLRYYADDVPLGFDPRLWIACSEAKNRLEGGGFAKPKPPLFPGENGRHRQRAFRDALADILPPSHGFAPTLRIAKFEVSTWIEQPGAQRRLTDLLLHRIE